MVKVDVSFICFVQFHAFVFEMDAWHLILAQGQLYLHRIEIFSFWPKLVIAL